MELLLKENVVELTVESLDLRCSSNLMHIICPSSHPQSKF